MRIMRFLTSRITLVGFALIVQIAVIFTVSEFFNTAGPVINGSIRLLSVIVVCFVINEPINTSIKMTWIVFILITPVAGSILYILTGGKKPRKWLSNALIDSERKNEKYKKENTDAEKELYKKSPALAVQSRYLKNTGFNLFKNTSVKYFSSGEMAFPFMLEEIKKAEKFIFLEYFILDKGEMLSEIEYLLCEKAKNGVDVRVIYDDFGCLFTLPDKYCQHLEEKGIKCLKFNPFVPFLSAVMNNRDHRKILVIDNRVAFTGGINIADEYINKKTKYGYWKDNALMLKGEGVSEFTRMFLSFWSAFKDKDEDRSKFFKEHEGGKEAKGYVQPFCDSPLDDDLVSSDIYVNAINGAKNYIYIFTPYLIPNYEISSALCLAAKKGVDVKIVVPGIPDKKGVYILTKSHFDPLVRAGVKIYVFYEGFVHSKGFVADDRIAMGGTVNLDYRSLHHHFECGVVLYNHDGVMEIKRDFEETFPKCTKVEERGKRHGIIANTYYALLRLIAPLM